MQGVELEMQREAMLEEIERVRDKAFGMLREKDMELRRVTLKMSKYHQVLRDHDLSDEEIAGFVHCTSDELATEGDEEYKSLEQRQDEEQGQTKPQMQATEPRADILDKIEYLRNVFLKYLFLRYGEGTNKKQPKHITPETEHYMRTIE